jgi:hypothetical protein
MNQDVEMNIIYWEVCPPGPDLALMRGCSQLNSRIKLILESISQCGKTKSKILNANNNYPLGKILNSNMKYLLVKIFESSMIYKDILEMDGYLTEIE